VTTAFSVTAARRSATRAMFAGILSDEILYHERFL
jgi:hypothetical protein